MRRSAHCRGLSAAHRTAALQAALQGSWLDVDVGCTMEGRELLSLAGAERPNTGDCAGRDLSSFLATAH
jgi:hypothetical protein